MLNKKFWMPWCIVLLFILLLELVVRMGTFDYLINPHSYLGKAVIRHQALKEFGYDKVNVISMGDSRLDWGLDHGQLRTSFKNITGQEYIRFTFEQSGFLAIQTTAEWAIKNLPNLEEIILGFDGTKIEPIGVYRQMMIALPFYNQVDFTTYDYNETNSNMLFDKVSRHFKLTWYYTEIKAWLSNPLSVIKNRKRYFKFTHPSIWDMKHQNNNNLCNYRLESLQSCFETAQILKSKEAELTDFEQYIVNLCTSDFATMKLSGQINGRSLTRDNHINWTDNWIKLFKKISNNGIKITLLILPESNISKSLVTPLDANEFINNLTSEASKIDQIQIYDFRNLFENNHIEECEVYSDIYHLNTKGLRYLTNELERLKFTNINFKW